MAASKMVDPEEQPLLVNDSKIILVCGSRNYDDAETITEVLGTYRKRYESITIIHGACSGADTIAQAYADYFKIPCKSYPALWKDHGRGAGPIRNQRMLDEGKPSLVLAFHDDIKSSKGTRDMVSKSMKISIPVMLISGTSGSIERLSEDML